MRLFTKRLMLFSATFSVVCVFVAYYFNIQDSPLVITLSALAVAFIFLKITHKCGDVIIERQKRTTED